VVRTTEKLMSDEAFERLALNDPDGQWELWYGVPRRKPGMAFWHGDATEELAYILRSQLDRSQFRVRSNKGRVRRPGESYFIPDVFVIPVSAFAPLRDRNDENELEAYAQPMSLVVEALSKSTRRDDRRVKLEEYKRRGDLEIWLLDPRTRSLTSWRIQPDGSYTETTQQGGTVSPAFLPNVSIDLDSLFE
jgi:Uma2 family endonuclease